MNKRSHCASLTKRFLVAVAMTSARPSLTQSGEPNGFGRSRYKFSCYFAQCAVCLPPTTRLLGEGRNPRIQPPQTHTLMTSEGLMAFGQSLLIGRLRMKRAVPRSARPSLLNHAWSYVKIRWNITGEVLLLPIGCDLPGHRTQSHVTVDLQNWFGVASKMHTLRKNVGTSINRAPGGTTVAAIMRSRLILVQLPVCSTTKQE
jgi:hypothetical protein